MKWSWTGFGGNLVVFTTSSEPEVDFSFLFSPLSRAKQILSQLMSLMTRPLEDT